LLVSLLSLFPGRSKRDKSSFMLLLPYFENRQFQRDHTDQLLGIESPSWRDFLPRLLDYAVFHGFLHRSERTVHEQVLFRLGRTHRPVVCSDIVDGKITRRHSKDLQREILAVTASLQMWGIRPGDRVALIGGNSTRYLTVDVAIGLAGGVSVPLYLTSPWEEIDVLLSASGARFLFMGDRNHFPQGREMRNDLPVVFFGRGSIPPGLTGKVISWEEFLDLGKGNSEVVSSPAEFGDIATIRYSSGTTGEPKGVMFRHHQLRWMAETIAALPPWKVRNHPVFYLSFLPLNHVVEGILGAYSPFYAPAPVNLFFLEDLHDLIRALPQVRPTLFFSVPRFYEKWWEIIQKKLVTNWFLRFQPGVVRQLLALFIRWFALRKAGLDRCVQFIAGSAPFREDLLQNFHALGIEIHNAYGLTEAPLLTINRVDRNRIGTVGEPLPETEISIAADGEIRGRGPQVTTGYFGQEGDSCLRDGWLLTGDIGNLTDEGFLVITGRKKDLLITSYGKNIYPMKIESMLRALPGVAEGILVGEGKPYCVALLWVDNPDLDPTWKDNLERLIPDINAGLSCPEQVKRWAVLSSPLSIEKGELTANLKLKRSVILTRYRPVIEALYEEREVADNVLFLGKIPDEYLGKIWILFVNVCTREPINGGESFAITFIFVLQKKGCLFAAFFTGSLVLTSISFFPARFSSNSAFSVPIIHQMFVPSSLSWIRA
ncbi:MAG: AMP-binding protein, partial [Candidatus Atribacteria bacterium]|nr:AMP-binding protein [Candidatus Atribacteria bacterium]